jgi:O-antigen/teichoic acid export membrane protein
MTNFLFNLLKVISSVIFPVLTFSYSSRILGADGVGKVNFAKSIISYFSMFAMLGMNYYGTREAAKIRDDRDALSKFVHEMLIINGVTTCIAYIALAVFILSVGRLQDYRVLLLINSFSILMLGMGMEWLYQALEEYRYIALRAMAFQLIAIVIMFMTVKDSGDVVNYTIVSTLAFSGSYVLNFFNSRKYVDFHLYGSYRIKRHLKPIFWLFAMALSIELYTVLDSTMLGFIKDDEAVGIYSAAIKINKLAITIITSLGVVLIPRLSYYVGQGNKEQFMKLIYKAYHFVFMFSIPSTMGLFALSDEIIRLFCGNGFESSGFTMKILTPIVLVIPFSVLTNQQIFVPLGKEKQILISTCIGAITNFTLNMLFIPKYSYIGASIATVVAELIVAIVCFINAKQTFDITGIFSGYYQYWIAAVPIIIIIKIIQWLDLGDIKTVLFGVVLSVGIYFMLLALMKNIYVYEMMEIVNQKIAKGKIRNENSSSNANKNE